MIFNTIWNAIYPENLYCHSCGDVIPQNVSFGLCETCVENLHWITENPFLNQLEGFSFDDVISLVYYEGLAKNIVHDLKFHEKRYMAESMGSLMGELYLELSAQPAVFVPVPMHPKKKQQRGYNQAELLGKTAACRAQMPFFADGLIKIKETTSQRQVSGDERRFALDGSIAINPKKIGLVEGKNVVLIDDVITTGSTAECCSQALKMGGAASVTVLTFAAVHYRSPQL